MERNKHFQVCADMCAVFFFPINKILKRFLEILGMRRYVRLFEEHRKEQAFPGYALMCAPGRLWLNKPTMGPVMKSASGQFSDMAIYIYIYIYMSIGQTTPNWKSNVRAERAYGARLRFCNFSNRAV